MKKNARSKTSSCISRTTDENLEPKRLPMLNKMNEEFENSKDEFSKAASN